MFACLLLISIAANAQEKEIRLWPNGAPGSLDDLKNNLTDLASRYRQDILVVEYSERKPEVNDIAFNLPGNKGTGTCIWEPLSTWEYFTGKDGSTNELIKIYDEVAKKYNIK
jgi:arabinogalactan endo-1,4-beta-galactosidase